MNPIDEELKKFVDELTLPDIIQTSLIVKYDDILNPELRDYFLDSPDDFLNGFTVFLEDRIGKNVDIRIKNIVTIEDVYVPIRHIRKKRINKIVVMEGIIRQVSAVRPKIISIKYECPTCGELITIYQVLKVIKYPKRCSCGRRGSFKEIEKKYIDCQKLVIEEPIETLDINEQPKRFNVLLFKDLTSPKTTRINTPGNRIKVSGILREYGKYTKFGETTERELLLEANFIEPTEESLLDISLSEKDKKEIIDFSKKEDFLQILIKSLSPDIEGYDIEKEAILYHLAGGTKVVEEGKLMRIGSIHILLISDTGMGKSKLCKNIEMISPKCLFIDATGTTGTGITASVVKDEFLGGYAIEAGALVLANNGTAIIDEIDKMNPEERKSLHVVLSEQIVVKHKANIHSTMRAETSVIGLSNPKTGKFDNFLLISEQLNMPSSLINRFDLIFPLRDFPEKEKDSKIIDSMLKIRKKKIIRLVEPLFFKKYLTYTKSFEPLLTEKAEEEIKDFYLRIRGASKNISSETIPITPRQGETLIKLTQASAKLRLSEKATTKDVKNAERIMSYFLTQVGINPETGEIDIERIEGIPGSTKKHKILEIILQRLSKENVLIPLDKIIEEAQKAKIDEIEVEELLGKMKMKGDLFTPKTNLYKLL